MDEDHWRIWTFLFVRTTWCFRFLGSIRINRFDSLLILGFFLTLYTNLRIFLSFQTNHVPTSEFLRQLFMYLLCPSPGISTAVVSTVGIQTGANLQTSISWEGGAASMNTHRKTGFFSSM